LHLLILPATSAAARGVSIVGPAIREHFEHDVPAYYWKTPEESRFRRLAWCIYSQQNCFDDITSEPWEKNNQTMVFTTLLY